MELENQYEILQVWGFDLMGVEVVLWVDSKKSKTVYINIAYYIYNTKAVNAPLGDSYMEWRVTF